MFYADLYALVDAGVIMMRQARPRGPIWIRRHRTIEEQQRDEDAWRAKGEAAIRREMDRRLEIYHQHKRRKDRFMRIVARVVSLAVLFCFLSPLIARAQTVVSPVAAEFDDSDFAALDGGQPVVVAYVIELWTPGTDTTQGSPQSTSMQVAKGLTTQVVGQPVTRRRLLLTTASLAIPPGPTWVATIKSIGPTGGTARSAVSNPFMVPIPVRAPKAVTGLVVVDK